ncbi:hypothetical protein L596_012526 [Steinernema carpocapsae]|uniref:Uncharacterized protein n=1 Tax=Steinernema carpocapsae TaxID=34508 RepID=A0A4U5NY76_STECR|nr:hypothetical protein L596_012526 [Steinernema carpocapsae]
MDASNSSNNATAVAQQLFDNRMSAAIIMTVNGPYRCLGQHSCHLGFETSENVWIRIWKNLHVPHGCQLW